jgi:hypothetical protein
MCHVRSGDPAQREPGGSAPPRLPAAGPAPCHAHATLTILLETLFTRSVTPVPNYKDLIDSAIFTSNKLKEYSIVPYLLKL